MAQYPTITEDVAAESAKRQEAADRRSDEAWEKALPVVKEWAAKGKPYIPFATNPRDLPQADIPAFPGAEGGGMYAFGGRGGQVYVVTNLNDSGPGSFREACEAGGPRIVVFNVAGIIQLKERIRIRAPYITIAGNTAPGDGVCIAGDTVELETHDVVIRHMRFRRGATWVGDRNDSIGGNPIGNIMIDHVSTSWGLDENMSMYRHVYHPDGDRSTSGIKLPTVNLTIQNSISSEALDTYHHAFGSTIGGYNSTFHHNLWANNTGRNASVGMIFDFTFINNTIFNWKHRTTDGGDHRSYYTMINNYYKPGPATNDGPIQYRVIKPEARRSKHFNDDFGRVYAAGNVIEGYPEVTADNWNGGVQLESGYENPEKLLADIRTDRPYPHSYVSIQPAELAYEWVLRNAGATLPKRDPVDERVIEMVRSGKVGYQDGIITDIAQVGGYPEYKGEPYQDSDGDGIPDEWELKYGLDPHDPSDASQDLNGNGYANIEEWINGRDPSAPPAPICTPHTYQDLFWGTKL
ncbi:MAG: polysaccharide lyase [Verrucomicrobiota bacterium JB022]|nr:polysaccharide lyase [Verrucomicrobiota bacterium JB022]